MPATTNDVKEIMYNAKNADEAKEKIRTLKDFVNPNKKSGYKKNIYDYIQSGNDEFFKEIEKYYVDKAKTENTFMYATDRTDTGTSPRLRGKVGGAVASSEEEDEEEQKEETRDEQTEKKQKAEALMEDTQKSINELSDLMKQIDQLKQDEANRKAEIDKTKDDVKRDDLEKNMDEVVQKRRATESVAQMTLNEIKTAAEKMDELDKSKVSEIENMIKDVSKMGDIIPTDTATLAEAPTMSPDDMEEEKRKKEEERKEEERKEAEKRKADEEEKERARVRRELGEREARRREAPQTTPSKGKDGPQMKITRSKADTVPDDIQPLPMERISTRNKNLAQLLDDLKFFFAQYPDTLRRDKEKYQKLDKMSMPLVERFHKMIVGKLYDPKKSRERVGIILDAREYIAQQVNEILARRATEGLKPEEIVSITQPEKKSDAQDYGNYEVKEGREGGVQFLRREPLYRLMPEINDKNVYPMEAKEKKGRLRVGPPQTRYNSMVQNAKIEFKQNPFTKKENVTRLRF